MPPQLNVGYNWSKYLTPEHEITGDISSDMGDLIDEAISKAENDETRNEYKRMKQLYEAVQQVVERETAKYDEYGYPKDSKDIEDDSAERLTETEKAELDESNIGRINDSVMFSRADDFTPDELEQMSTEDLGNMLAATQAENAAKREKLETRKREYLISQIRAAVAEGKELDAEIATVRESTKEK